MGGDWESDVMTGYSRWYAMAVWLPVGYSLSTRSGDQPKTELTAKAAPQGPQGRGAAAAHGRILKQSSRLAAGCDDVRLACVQLPARAARYQYIRTLHGTPVQGQMQGGLDMFLLHSYVG